MSLQLDTTVAEFLKDNSESKFTAREISDWIFRNFPAECEEKKANSNSIETDDELKQQIVAEIASRRPSLQKKHAQIKTTEGRPRRYFWIEESALDEVEDSHYTDAPSESISGDQAWNEGNLYPLLSEYLLTRHRVFSKRIDERKSRKQGKKANKWLYPDLVGMQDLTEGMEAEIKNVMKESADKRKTLWSFEVKKELKGSNVRESYFQAVSNSSWANFGYLVAAVILDETMNELRMLCSLHGIGLIQLDSQNPSESMILIPAREKTDVDWVTCNRIAGANNDFLEYIELVRKFHQTGDTRPSDWD